MNTQKKLSLAIYWHMHQPVYELEGTYLMPWVRLHAVKDYLDMALFLEKFPNIKLNFDIVPALLDSIIDYCRDDCHDIHSELSVADIEKLTEEEKSFIINNFFSAKYETMVFKNERFRELFQKRFSNDNFSIGDFSNQEYSDLMAVFNLVWIDPMHFDRYPRLKELWDKMRDYSQDDRVEIINIQRQIIKEIIPTYKKYIQTGRIELTTSPYYHPILPILIDIRSSAKTTSLKEGLPQSLGMTDDAKIQIRSGLDRIEEVFGVRPKGIWAPELCINQKTLGIFAKEDIKWTISDEGILSNSINFDFIRDFKGNLSDPSHLLKVYNYKTKKSDIDIIFRDRSIPNLINFEYAGINSQMAANDLYEKIKNIQNKILVSPDETHLLTIASDCENCWENYENDGIEFLENIYGLINNDSSIETVLISDYIESDKHKKSLNKVYSGSCIDKTFRFWIGDCEKNKAWCYLKKAKDDLEEYIKNNRNNPNIPLAKRELMIAEGSDWFWWYGEPNNSGQDFLFDYMFREHLKHIYNLLDIESPKFLDETIITSVEIPFKYPKGSISPRMDGLNSSSNDWANSGSISMLDGPVYRENKSVDKIDFGNDSERAYFRLHINKNSDETSFIERINQFYIYVRNASRLFDRAHIRLISKTDNPYPILTEKFEHEIALTLYKDTLYPPRLATVLHSDMWTLDNPDGIDIVYEDVSDVSIPFEKLGVKNGETLEFFLANTDSGVKNTSIPQEILISMTRN